MYLSNNRIREIINEYLDKEYMQPLWKSLNMDEKPKYMNWLNNYENIYKFLTFLFHDLEEEIEDGYRQLKPLRKNNPLRKIYNTYPFIYTKALKYINKNYENLKPYIAHYFKIRKFISSNYDPQEWNSNLIFQKPSIVKNIWVIHFDNGYKNIGRDKTEINMLAYTYNAFKSTRNEDDIKKGGYSFGYDISDINNMTMSKCLDALLYGNKITMFRCNGIKVYHPTDREWQVIYNPKQIDKHSKVFIYGETDKEHIYWDENDTLNKNNDCKVAFSIYDWNKCPIYRTENLITAINWVRTNFDQYRKLITTREIINDKKTTDNNVDYEEYLRHKVQSAKNEKHLSNYEKRDFLAKKRLYDELPQEVKNAMETDFTPENSNECLNYAVNYMKRCMERKPNNNYEGWSEMCEKLKYYERL